MRDRTECLNVICRDICENLGGGWALQCQRMPKVLSRNFGEIEYVAGEQFVFPNGLPGFPSERVFVPVEVPEQLPLLYLQSAQTPDLCFVNLPVSCIIAGIGKSAPEFDARVFNNALATG